MYAGGAIDTTRGLDKIDTTGIDLGTMTAKKNPVVIGEEIPVGLTIASLEAFMATRAEVAELSTERLPTGIRGWFRRLFNR